MIDKFFYFNKMKRLVPVLLIFYPVAIYTSALHDAVRHGDVKKLQKILDESEDIDVNAIDDSNLTALELAVMENHSHMVEALLKAGANPNIIDEEGSTLLMFCVENEYIETLKILIHYGADLNIQNIYGKTVLFFAQDKLSMKEIKEELIQKGANIHIKDNRGYNLISLAALQCNRELIFELAKIGAKEIAWEALLSSAACAVKTGDIPLFDLLIGFDLDINEDFEAAPLIVIAAKNDQIEMVRHLIKLGANLNRLRAQRHRSALQMAILNKNYSMVKLLIDHGADINHQDDYGLTCLLMASSVGQLEVLKLLINRGSDVNAPGVNGKTILMVCAMNGYKEMVNLLLKKGADIHAIDDAGQSALDYAIKNNKKEISEIIKEELRKGK